MHSILTFSEFVLITDSLFEPKHAEPVFVQTFAEFVAYQESILSEQDTNQPKEQSAAKKQANLQNNYGQTRANYQNDFYNALRKANFNVQIAANDEKTAGELHRVLVANNEYREPAILKKAEMALLRSPLFKKILQNQPYFSDKKFYKSRESYFQKLSELYENIRTGKRQAKYSKDLVVAKDPNINQNQLTELFTKYNKQMQQPKIIELVTKKTQAFALDKILQKNQFELLKLHAAIGGEKALDDTVQTLAMSVIDGNKSSQYLSDPNVQKIILPKMQEIFPQLQQAGIISSKITFKNVINPAGTIAWSKKKIADINNQLKRASSPNVQQNLTNAKNELTNIVKNLGNQFTMLQKLAARTAFVPTMQKQMIDKFIADQKKVAEAEAQRAPKPTAMQRFGQGFMNTMGAIGRGWQAISNS